MHQVIHSSIARNIPPHQLPQVRSFPRKVRVDFSVGRYTVRTIDTEAEFAQVLTLRRDVFLAEFAGKDLVFLNDCDSFDELSDVLAISEHETGRIVGAYRLIGSLYSDRYYTETEFALGDFADLPGVKLELSRACIAPDQRNGIVISLLWKGLAEYARLTGTDYLFGLSSVNTVRSEEAAAIFRHFDAKGLVDFRYGIAPLSGGKIEDLTEAVRGAVITEDQQQGGSLLVPSLLKSYIKAGARVCSYPVIDHEFRCIDFLTVLRWKDLATSYQRRFTEN